MRSLALPVSLVLACLAATGCGGGPTAPSGSLDSTVILSPGQQARVEPASLLIRFNGVTGDSRCPADAVCIQGGSADVRITARSDGFSRDYELRTGDLRPVQHAGFTIALQDVSPYPFSSRTVRPDEYRVTIRITRGRGADPTR